MCFFHRCSFGIDKLGVVLFQPFLQSLYGAVATTANLQGHSGHTAQFGLNVAHPPKLVIVNGVEFTRAAGRVNAMHVGVNRPPDVGGIDFLIELVVFVPGHRHAGPDAVQVFCS